MQPGFLPPTVTSQSRQPSVFHFSFSTSYGSPPFSGEFIEK
uniref:Uncharacterized protein n=1 Tax=Anguilla anguilla TaxID=7936 RepID=A0A0E9Q206_ANGAN